jgi:site-specific DNA-methyltransferase (adenine-specific)
MDPHLGRWPANLCLDEEAAAILDEQTVSALHSPGIVNPAKRGPPGAIPIGGYGEDYTTFDYGDRGGASRFFYCAKAGRRERNAGLAGFNPLPMRRDSRILDGLGDAPSTDGARSMPERNHHPTVKPLALMRWLVRLVTPPGGTVLDPFAGSGTTGTACVMEGFDFIGIEQDVEYCEIARWRIAWAEKEAALPLFDRGGEPAGGGRTRDLGSSPGR